MTLDEPFLKVSGYFNGIILNQTEVVNDIIMSLQLRNLFQQERGDNPITLPLNILVRGDSGTGKTHIVRTICKSLDIPFVAQNITDYTSAGHTGGSLVDILGQLIEVSNDILIKTVADDKPVVRTINRSKSSPPDTEGPFGKELDQLANMMGGLPGWKVSGKAISGRGDAKDLSQAIKLAETKGVVFLDEIDKLLFKDPHYNVGTTGVLRELLGFLSGSEIVTKKGVIDTTNIIFICAGAFNMVSYKDIPVEMLGRLSSRVKTNPPEPWVIREMLLRPEIDMLHPLRTVIKLRGKEDVKLSLEDATYVGEQLCAHEAKKQIGLRRLTAFITELVKHYFTTDLPKDSIVNIERSVLTQCIETVDVGISDEETDKND